ncbi:hypothetical protein Tco_0863549 [Tanacetum coccineum]
MFSMTSLGANVDNFINNGKGTNQYELLIADTIEARFCGESLAMENDFDIIVEEHSRFPQGSLPKEGNCFSSTWLLPIVLLSRVALITSVKSKTTSEMNTSQDYTMLLCEGIMMKLT